MRYDSSRAVNRRRSRDIRDTRRIVSIRFLSFLRSLTVTDTSILRLHVRLDPSTWILPQIFTLPARRRGFLGQLFPEKRRFEAWSDARVTSHVLRVVKMPYVSQVAQSRVTRRPICREAASRRMRAFYIQATRVYLSVVPLKGRLPDTLPLHWHQLSLISSSIHDSRGFHGQREIQPRH